MIQNIYPDTKWLLDKLGCFSASRIVELMSDPQSKAEKDAGALSASARGYVMEKISELMTGTIRTMENVHSLDWGKRYEPIAIDELRKFYNVEYFGGENQVFWKYTEWSGSSPDAIMDGNIYAELKCPENPENHIDNLLIKTQDDLKRIRKTYYYQIQMGMFTFSKERQIKLSDISAQFVSYCPLMQDESKRLYGIIVLPDLELKDKIDSRIARAEEELRKIIQHLTT